MIKVYTSSVLEAPADAVWARVRDFNGLPRWTPFVAESRIEEARASDQVGCVRAFRMKDGGRLRERLLALSDYDYSYILDPREPAGGRELHRHPAAHPHH